jgi:GGDEF domain-containing protein
VLGGVAAQALAFILWSQQLLEQSYVPGQSLLDPLWVVGLLPIGVGAALTVRAPAATITVGEPSHRGGLLPTAMFVVLLAALVQARFAYAPAGAEIALAAGLMFSGAALIVRTRLLEGRLWVLLGRERAALGNLAQREVELGRLNAQLAEDSRRDALTGMRNRRAMSDDLPMLEAMHQERGDSFALALCDVDRFKAYNDRLGHLAGDQALRAIAASVRGALRVGDTAYRFGGEELLLVLGKATALATRLRRPSGSEPRCRKWRSPIPAESTAC